MIVLIHCHHLFPPHQFTLRMSRNTSQPGKPVFSIFYPCHRLRTTSGKWGYVGKAPPRSSTSSSASSVTSASRDSSTNSRALLVSSRSTMPPRARPVARPGPSPHPPQASSQSSRPSSGTPLPTSFRFLRRDTVTPSTATPSSVPTSLSKPAIASETVPVSGLVSSQLHVACICAIPCYRMIHIKWRSMLRHPHPSPIPRSNKLL